MHFFIALAVAFVFATFAASLSALYVSHERTLYSWDYANYWLKALSATTKIRALVFSDAEAQPAATVGSAAAASAQEDEAGATDGLARFTRLAMRVVESIWYEDYNDIPVLPLLPILLFVGAERPAYVVSLVLVYVTAVTLALFYASSRFRPGDGRVGATELVAPLLVLAAVPLFWAPTLRGMVDAGAVALNLLAVALYFGTPLAELSLKRCATVGLLLAGAVLFRRYNGFFLAAFAAVSAIDAVLQALAERSRERRRWLSAAARPIVVAGAAGAVLALLAPPFLVRALTVDYGDLYSAFRAHSSALDHFAHLRATVGDLTLALFVLASAITLFEAKTRRLSLALTAQALFIFVLVDRTQTLAFHHITLFLPAFLLLASLALSFVLDRLARPSARACVAIVLALVAAVQSWATFAPQDATRALRARAASLFPDPAYPPLVRHDLDAMAQLYAAVDAALEEIGDYAMFYVLSASWTLNEVHFRPFAVRPPLVFRSPHRLLSSHVVDKVDGFPIRLFAADLVVAATPPGGWEGASFVLRLPWHDLATGTGIGAAFAPIATLEGFEDGLVVTLFRRIRPNTSAEIADLAQRLRAIYPDRPQIYAPPVDPRR